MLEGGGRWTQTRHLVVTLSKRLYLCFWVVIKNTLPYWNKSFAGRENELLFCDRASLHYRFIDDLNNVKCRFFVFVCVFVYSFYHIYTPRKPPFVLTMLMLNIFQPSARALCIYSQFILVNALQHAGGANVWINCKDIWLCPLPLIINVTLYVCMFVYICLSACAWNATIWLNGVLVGPWKPAIVT